MQKLHTLPNGFRIVTEDMPGLKSASVGIWVTAGGRHEQAEQTAIGVGQDALAIFFLHHVALAGEEARFDHQRAHPLRFGPE